MVVSGNGTGEALYLIGRPTLSDYIHWAAGHAVDCPSEARLAEDWRAANEIVRQLEREEAGCADGGSSAPPGPEYDALLKEFHERPLVKHSYNTVPTEVVMVELDRLVVYQKHIDLAWVPELEASLGRAPSPEQLFNTCLSANGQPPARYSRVHGDKYVFVSHSNDLRFLGAMPLEPRNLVDVPPPGNTVAVVGIFVGYGSNFMNAIEAEGRIILNNGSHRAYALRHLGLTHAPCVVQHARSRDELHMLAPSEVRGDPDAFLKHPRPMMLKDYLDPRLRRVFAVHRRLHQVTVSFEVDDNVLPAL